MKISLNDLFLWVHASTSRLTSSSKNLAEARSRSLTNIDKINWPDGFFRKDIGWRVIDNK